MVKKLLPHISFHISAHHMSLIADIIFAQALDHIHKEQPYSNPRKHLQDRILILDKKCLCCSPQDLWISQIHKTYDDRTEQIHKKDRFVWAIVADKFFQCIHK